jgi:hypothetical protein
MSQNYPKQPVSEREFILKNLPEGTHRVQVTNEKGVIEYKRPEEVDILKDDIMLNSRGEPILMMGKPGRKRRPLNPASPALASVAQAREDHIELDSVLLRAKKEATGEDTLDAIILGLSEEAAVLEFDRIEAQRKGEDGSNYAIKRARVLRQIGDLILKRRSQRKGSAVEIESEEFKVLFLFLLETFRGAMESSGARSELIETTFTKLTGTLDATWIQEAKTRMKQVAKP